MPPVDQPLRFQPLFKRIRWGGRRLGSELGKAIGPEADYAESWELVDHGRDQSLVSQGPFKGLSLSRLLTEHGPAILGKARAPRTFPLLVKFLDARDRLSVQVHPNDEQAARYIPGESGKTEAWVILAADPGSCVYAGLKTGVGPEELRLALATGTVEECLHRLTVRPGDCVFIPAGTVHAIGEGVLLAEVQQSSDLTFRLFDWNRVGVDGKPRELHLEQSLECVDFSRGPVAVSPPEVEAESPVRRERLVTCPYFTVRRYFGPGETTVLAAERCVIWIVLRGLVRLSNQAGTTTLQRGDTTLIPASACPLTATLADDTIVVEAFWS